MKIQGLATTSAFRAMAPMAPQIPAPAAEPTDRLTRSKPAEVKPSEVKAAAPASFEVVKRVPSERWAWTELLRDPDPHFVQRNFHPRQAQRHPEVVAAFGTATPHSGDVLLHYAGDPPEGVERHETPVLLVHGASADASFWSGPYGKGSGLLEFLRDQGHQVYAVTFAHNHDDNFLQAEQLANAIERLKTLTGQDKVDVVGHSKGTVAARMYASDVREPWMTPFRDDVRRLVLIGGPNGGIDYSFRHPMVNFALYGDSDNHLLNAPISWDRMVAYGRMRDTSKVGFGSQGPDHWPGQRQMLARWDQEYSLSLTEPDFYTTYHGGRGFVSVSKGVDHYAAEGGNLIQRLAEHPIKPSVEVALLAGNRPNFPGILNEYTGPSDGLVFVESAMKLPDEVNVTAAEVMPLHHVDLTRDAKANQWVADVLEETAPQVLSADERRAVVQDGLSEGRHLLQLALPKEGEASLLQAGEAGLPQPKLLSGLAMPEPEEEPGQDLGKVAGILLEPGGNLLP